GPYPTVGSDGWLAALVLTADVAAKVRESESRHSEEHQPLGDDGHVEPCEDRRRGGTRGEGEQEEARGEHLPYPHCQGEDRPHPAPSFVVHALTSLSCDCCRAHHCNRGESVENRVPPCLSMFLRPPALNFFPRGDPTPRS